MAQCFQDDVLLCGQILHHLCIMMVWRVVTVNSTHVMEMVRNTDGKLKITGGVDGVLLRLLSRYVPFEYELIEQTDGHWGGIGPDGKWNGMIGTLQKGDADMALVWIAATYDRNQVVDFSFPYMIDTTIFFTASPHLSPSVFAFADPFDDVVWLVLLFCIILSAVITNFLTNYSVRTKGEFSFFQGFIKEISRFFQLLLSQGTYKVYKTVSVQMFMSIWSLAKLVLVFSYCSTLLSIMMVPTSEKPIDTVQELRDAIKEGKYHVAVSKSTSHYAYLKGAESGALKDLADDLERHPENLLSDSTSGRDKILKGEKVAVFSMRMNFRIICSQVGTHLFHQSKETIGYNPVSIAFKRRFPKAERFNIIIQRITQAGLYKRELDMLQYTLSKNTAQRASSDRRALNLADLKMPLQILMLLESVAFIVLLLELLQHRIKSHTVVKNIKPF